MKKKLHCFMVLAVLFSTGLIAGCGHKIEGEVLDGKGAPIAGVTVQIAKSRFTAKTDNSGHYAIDYAPGKLDVHFSKEGYGKQTLSLDIYQKTHFPAETVTLYAFGNNTSPEKLAKSVVQTLIREDKKAFQAFAVPEKEALLEFFGKKLPEHKRAKATREINENYKGIKSKVARSWNDVYDDGLRDGIDWESVKYEQVEYEPVEEKGIHSTDIYITISSDTGDYIIKIDDSLRIGPYWHIFDGMRWRGKSD